VKPSLSTALLLAAIVVSIPQHAFALVGFYWAQSVDGTVVDAETKLPIAGATVLAHWAAVEGVPEGSSLIGQIAVVEARTDESGRFHLVGWGPRFSGRPWGKFREDAPGIFVFSPSYKYWRGSNELGANDLIAPWTSLKSDWNQKTIELQRFYGNAFRYAEHLQPLGEKIQDLIRYEPRAPCIWKQMPLMLGALERQWKEFQQQKAWAFHSPVGELIANQASYEKKGCGSVDAFLGQLDK